jgi:NAD(P)-dependent dehydrogenase (short-subunit alcohol dehydrogenase family)
MNGRVCVVTGGNGGIGRATATELARQGATVVIICRSRERGEEALQAIKAETKNPNVELVLADLSSLSQVRRAAADILAKHKQIHVLVNNAAVFLPRREETEDGFEKTLATNYLSHFLLTMLLLDALKAGAPSRIVNVATKTMGIKVNFDDLQLKKSYSTMKAVGPTKMALILFTQKLAQKLEGTGVTVNALHPGLVKSDLLDDMPWLMRTMFRLMSGSVENGARTPVYLATSPEVAKVSGKLFADCKQVKAGGQAQDPAAVEKMWDLSVQMTKLDARA